MMFTFLILCWSISLQVIFSLSPVPALLRLSTTAIFFFLSPLQVLQAMGYPTGFDSDLDPMSSDEKSDGEGKSETSSHSSNNPTHSTDSSNTLEVRLETHAVCQNEEDILLNVIINHIFSLARCELRVPF